MNIIVAKVIEFLKGHTELRKRIVIIVYKIARMKYKLIYGRRTVLLNVIVFESYMGRQYACSPKAIYEELIRDKAFDNFEFIWMFADTEKMKSIEGLRRAHIVKYGSREAYDYYSKAKYVISNSNIKFDIVPKYNQVFVQTWHGTPLKRLRCDIKPEFGNDMNTIDEIRYKNDQDIERYKFFLSPSRFSTEKFITAFRLKELNKENIIIEKGYPRNDFLFNYTGSDIDRIKRKLGLYSDKRKIILYAPTFRDNRHDAKKGYMYDLKLNFKKLREDLASEYVILFRTHYFIANKFDFKEYESFVIDVTYIDDINELYIISDMIITDYSSVVFDYSNLKRPIVFYMYDFEEYENNIRGFYINVEELPGEIVYNQEQLTHVVKENNFIVGEKYDSFNNKYNALEDGNASRRVIKTIFDV